MTRAEGVPRAAYRVKEFAKALGVSERLVWRQIERGRIRSYKVGRCRLIPASEMARFVGESQGEERESRPSIPISRKAREILNRMRG